jgi:hypothetical protein
VSWQASRTTRTRPAQTRLPWWALALPALAFAVLLALVAAPGASAAPAAEPLAALFDRILRLLPGLVGHFL